MLLKPVRRTRAQSFLCPYEMPGSENKGSKNCDRIEANARLIRACDDIRGMSLSNVARLRGKEARTEAATEDPDCREYQAQQVDSEYPCPPPSAEFLTQTNLAEGVLRACAEASDRLLERQALGMQSSTVVAYPRSALAPLVAQVVLLFPEAVFRDLALV